MKPTSDTHSVDRAQLPEKILNRLASICGTQEVRTNLDTRLYERQVFDSMKTVEFIVAIEQDFGLYISPAELDREAWATPRQIIADILNRLKS